MTATEWKPVANAFCPTGPGGGVDPSCGREDGTTLVRSGKEFGGFGSGTVPDVSRDEPVRNPLSDRSVGNVTKALNDKGKDALDAVKDVTHVDVRSLKAWQGIVYKTDALKKLPEDVQPIKVVVYKGQNVIWDGNHRAAVAFAEGRETLPAHVLDLGANQKYLKPKFRTTTANSDSGCERPMTDAAQVLLDLGDGWAPLRNAFCPGEGARDNSCSSSGESGSTASNDQDKVNAARERLTRLIGSGLKSTKEKHSSGITEETIHTFKVGDTNVGEIVERLATIHQTAGGGNVKEYMVRVKNQPTRMVSSIAAGKAVILKRLVDRKIAKMFPPTANAAAKAVYPAATDTAPSIVANLLINLGADEDLTINTLLAAGNPEEPSMDSTWRPLAANADTAADTLLRLGRDRYLINAFCPTGEGGGQDNSCSSREGSSGGAAAGKSPRFKSPPLKADAKDTQEAYQKADGSWTPERVAIHKKIADEVFAGKRPVAKPTAYLMGGGPAAGKSTVIAKLGLPENVVHINPDEFKEKLPEYEKGVPTSAGFVHEESSALAKNIQAKASEGGYNTLLDGTGDSSAEVLEKRVNAMKAAGQRVEGHYVTVDIETAIARSLSRAKRTGRYVPESVLRGTHASVSRVIPEAIKRGLFDKFTLTDSSAGGGLVASAEGNKLTIHDAAAWERFLAKGKD